MIVVEIRCQGCCHANDLIIAPISDVFGYVEGDWSFVGWRRLEVCAGLKSTERSVASGGGAVGTDREVLVSLVGTTEAVARWRLVAHSDVLKFIEDWFGCEKQSQAPQVNR